MIKESFYAHSGAAQTSKTDDWPTPHNVVEYAYKRFHSPITVGEVDRNWFDTDPAASQYNYVASNYHTVEDNGLIQAWTGKVWLNPPYGRTIGHWVDKALLEVEFNSECKTITLCIPARTDTLWFHRLISRGAKVVFIKGRLKFGASKSSAPFPSCLVHIERGQTDIETFYEAIL
jgi:site-specific DNA-methyltransferase (adenine-specific)